MSLHVRIAPVVFIFSSANRQFIQSRLLHLAQAFNHRAQVSRRRIALPATPSSSRETLETTPVATKKSKVTTTENGPEAIAKIKNTSISNLSNYITNRYNNNVIDPQGTAYRFWMLIAASSVLYNAFIIPLRSAFPTQTPNNRSIWMFFDYLMDTIYLIDIVLIQPRIMFLNEGFWITDIHLTRHNYFKKSAFKVWQYQIKNYII